VIGGGLVASDGTRWYAQTRILTYLNEMLAGLGRVVFFAAQADAEQIGTVFRAPVSPGIRIEPMRIVGGFGKARKAARMLKMARRMSDVIRQVPVVIHIFPAAGGPVGLAAVRRHAKAHIMYLKSDWIEYTLNRPGDHRAIARYWQVSELLEMRTCDAAVFRSGAHLKKMKPHCRGIVEPAQPMLSVVESDAPGVAAGGTQQVLFVGTLQERKGLSDLAAAMGMLRERGVDLRLALVGGVDANHKGPAALPEWLRRAFSDAGVIDRVDVKGYIDEPTELAGVYQASTLLVLPSRPGGEGFPRVIDEAASFGLPVVATAVAGIPLTLTDGHDSLLVPPLDPPALAGALERLLGSAELRDTLSAGGRASFHARVKETAGQQHIRLIRDIWARKHAAPRTRAGRG